MTVQPAERPLAMAHALTRVPHLLYGGDYSPEQWPEEVWAEDVALMREAGVNMVSIGMFTWVKLEPGDGRFDFAWLDRLLALLHEAGIAVDLATPTASPPAWLVRADPAILPRDASGTVLWHGSRHHYCPHADGFRTRALRIARALAEHVAGHPALAMWHVDNEIACHVEHCFCDASVAAFRNWLRKRHGSLDGLNEAWAAAFWGQTYTDWSEVDAPRRMPTFRNPGQQLDWRRFWSDSWRQVYLDQAAILREVTPGIPVMTNWMGFFPPVDYWAQAPHQDLITNDCYADTSEPDWMIESGMVSDLMRSLGDRRPWVLLESATTNVQWRPRNATKRPGVMRLFSLQAVARGADGVMFFQWRASLGGGEQFHSAMLQHGGKEHRTWREVTALGAELGGLDALIGSRVAADVGILFDWESWWALGGDGKPAPDLHLVTLVKEWYAATRDERLTVDFVHPHADLSRYRLLIAPTLHLVDEETARNLGAWVERGGTLVVSFFSGIVDRDARVHAGAYPAPLRQLLGIVVEEYAAQNAGPDNAVVTPDGQTFRSDTWWDIVRTEGAEVLATHSGDFFAGTPAVTRVGRGSGSAFYVATRMEAAGTTWVVRQAMEVAGVAAPPRVTPAGANVEVTRRESDRGLWWFVLNHESHEVTVDLPAGGTDLVHGVRVHGPVLVGALDAVIVQVD
jgi:beta-galactosidase